MKSAIFGLALIMLIGSMGYAQHMGRMCCEKEGEMAGYEDIGLTAEQKVKIEEIETNTRKTIIPIRSQIEIKELDMNKEMKAEKPNKEKILKMAQEIHELEWQIKKAHLEEQISIASLLTPEQREKMRMMHRKKMIKRLEIRKDLED
ncbi:MAG: Spy/CpxP family protein refolding chaperone [bacterium]